MNPLSHLLYFIIVQNSSSCEETVMNWLKSPFTASHCWTNFLLILRTEEKTSSRYCLYLQKNSKNYPRCSKRTFCWNRLWQRFSFWCFAFTELKWCKILSLSLGFHTWVCTARHNSVCVRVSLGPNALTVLTLSDQNHASNRSWKKPWLWKPIRRHSSQFQFRICHLICHKRACLVSEVNFYLYVIYKQPC